MAIQVQHRRIGVDVSKAELEIAGHAGKTTEVIRNDRRAIRQWLKQLDGPSAFAIEATNVFHLAFVEEAHALGHTVYLIDGYRLNRYRDSVGGRAKTDRTDALLLRRYLEREEQDLRPWTPPPAGYAELHRLLHRRSRLVQARTQIRQSFSGAPELKSLMAKLIHSIDQVDAAIRKRINCLVRHSSIASNRARCQQIEGIGPLTSVALANAFQRGAFQSSDAFIAFLGLDVRVRESGTYRGRRRLTKKGDPELRRLLHNAAMAARRSATWAPVYDKHIQRGLAPTQVLVILARKLARVAFALMTKETDYVPKLTREACPAT